MLQDLEQRNDGNGNEPADYQKNPTPYTKKLLVFIIVLLLVVIGYFSFRHVGSAVFIEAFEKLGLFEQEQPQANAKKVSVNSELDKMMPARSGNNTDVVSVPVKNGELQPESIVESDSNLISGQTSYSPSSPTSGITTTSELKADISQKGTLNAGNQDALTQTMASAVSSKTSESEGIGAQNQTADNENGMKESTQVVDEASESSGKETFEVARSAEMTSEEKISSLLTAANEAVQAERMSSAIAAFYAILELQPSRHDVRKRLAVLLYSNEQESDADMLLRQGLDLAPDRIDLRLMLGRLLHRQQKTSELYNVLKVVRPSVEQHSEYLSLLAMAAQQLNHHQEASELYGLLASYEPEQSRWWLGIAVASDKMQNVPLALDSYRRVQDLNQLPVSVMEFVKQRIEALGG